MWAQPPTPFGGVHRSVPTGCSSSNRQGHHPHGSALLRSRPNAVTVDGIEYFANCAWDARDSRCPPPARPRSFGVNGVRASPTHRRRMALSRRPGCSSAPAKWWDDWSSREATCSSSGRKNSSPHVRGARDRAQARGRWTSFGAAVTGTVRLEPDSQRRPGKWTDLRRPRPRRRFRPSGSISLIE
jgi:hypothetical protein